MTERQRIKNNERAKAWNQAHKNDPKWKSRRKKYHQTHKEQIMARVKKWKQEKKNKINQLKENE